MPRSISPATRALLAQNKLEPRDFMTIYARNRDTGETVEESMWSDVGNVSANVINPDTGFAETREFYGTGNLVKISDIPLVSNLSVQNVNIELSHIASNAEALIRGYDVRQAVVQIFRGLFDPDTGTMVEPAYPRFSGFVDSVEVVTPSENDEGSNNLTCASHTQEVTRSNTATRSDSSQKIINSNDSFYRDAASTAEWKIWWGQAQGESIG
jgi:hypothetical protein